MPPPTIESRERHSLVAANLALIQAVDTALDPRRGPRRAVRVTCYGAPPVLLSRALAPSARHRPRTETFSPGVGMPRSMAPPEAHPCPLEVLPALRRLRRPPTAALSTDLVEPSASPTACPSAARTAYATARDCNSAGLASTRAAVGDARLVADDCSGHRLLRSRSVATPARFSPAPGCLTNGVQL